MHLVAFYRYTSQRYAVNCVSATKYKYTDVKPCSMPGLCRFGGAH